ncbi:hypothetical protein RQP46_005934 [Phenoliferia psychrophenolica]
MATIQELPRPTQSTDNMVDFAKDFKALTLQGMQPRPDAGGKAGRPIPLLVNLYGLTFKHKRGSDLLIHHYIWDALATQHPDLAPALAKAAYDSRKNSFSPVPFPFGTGEKSFAVTLPPHTPSPTARPREFEVKISHAQTIDFACLAKWTSKSREGASLGDEVAVSIQAFDVLLRHDAIRRQGTISGGQGRKIFEVSSGIDIGAGVEVLKGFFQSVRPTMGGLVVNLDTAYSPYLRSGSLLTLINAMVNRESARGGPPGGRGVARGGRGGGRGGFGGGHAAAGAGANAPKLNFAEIKQLLWLLRGQKVRVTHRISTKEYVIVGFGDSANVHTFSMDAGPRPDRASAVQRAAAANAGRPLPADAPAPQRQVTVEAYFKEKYNMRLQHPNLQVIEVRGREFIPIEALELLPGAGVPPTRLGGDQAAAMIKVAAKRPEERQLQINQQRAHVAYEANARIGAWDIEASMNMKQITGRVLAPPKVQYSPLGKVKEPSVGRGQWNLLDTKYIGRNKPLEHWGILCFAGQNQLPLDRLQWLVGQLVKQLKDRGMAVPNERPSLLYGSTSGDARLQCVKDLARSIVTAPGNKKKEAPQLMIFILTDPKTYDDIKRDVTMALPVPVASQVMLFKNLMKDERQLGQYFGNVSMKLNVKLHGSNWVIAPTDLPKMTAKTIMMGADVTHPPPARGGEAIAPSVAAVVGTGEGSNQTYSAQVRTQEGRQEVIAELKDMSQALIEQWRAKNKGVLPENLLFFRDGVSEGQFATVVEQEIPQLRAACRAIDPRYSPKLTYIVCAKRHNVRFFATSDQNRDRSGNLPAGTVVDTDVTHPYIWDFYLQSHAGLVGTCRPTHYICLLDENQFTSDTMEKVVNSLCYSFARATRSVSLVPVAYYADIVCTKARSYAYLDDSASSMSSGATARLQTRSIQDALERTNVNTPNHKFPGSWFM